MVKRKAMKSTPDFQAGAYGFMRSIDSCLISRLDAASSFGMRVYGNGAVTV
jgi:hypothetical protein